MALAAVHAARSSQIRALRLDDVDLPNRRLTIAEHTRPLDDFTHQILLQRATIDSTLAEHRQQTPLHQRQHQRPRTRQPSLDQQHPTGTDRHPRATPDSTDSSTRPFIHRADPLHLTAVFDISDTTAIRYADSARQLLNNLEEQHLLSSPQTQTLPPA